MIGIPENKKHELKEQIGSICISEDYDMAEHVKYQDLEWIIKHFEVKDVDRKYENGVLNAIYSKLALKGL